MDIAPFNVQRRQRAYSAGAYGADKPRAHKSRKKTLNIDWLAFMNAESDFIEECRATTKTQCIYR